MNEFINCIIKITINYPIWVERAKNEALLVIHTIFRLLQSSEPMKLDDPLSFYKLSGEGKLAKHKTCLVWDIKKPLFTGIPNEKKRDRPGT